MTEIRNKKLVQTINHDSQTVAIELHREEQLSNGRWVALDPTDWSNADLSDFTATFDADTVQMLTEVTQQRDVAIAELSEVEAALETAQARIEELEAQLNPPSPFPDANWSAFRLAALSDPAVQRVAVGNPVIWPLLLMFLNEMSTNPQRGYDIAMLWNMMEANVPVNAEEIARVNALATEHGIPLAMNSEGQIVTP